ncbi:MAG: glycosyltransferase, partial [Brooklawnia sp.]
SHYMPDLFGRWDAYNRIGTRLNWMIATNLGRPILRRMRASNGRNWRTAANQAGPQPAIIAASPLLVPPAADWPQGTYQTGYLAMPRLPMLPPSELVDFLGTGPKPIFVGFGSLSGVSGRHGGDVELLADSARIAHRRVVTTVGPGQRIGLVDDRVLLIEPIPHNWLLPRMAGMIHHGGAGSTHEGLRAGLPSMAVPFEVDQPYHAERLHSLGVGPSPLPVERLTPRSLARAMRELTSGRYDERAALIGVQARAEDGVGATIKVLARLGLIPKAALEGSGP